MVKVLKMLEKKINVKIINDKKNIKKLLMNLILYHKKYLIKTSFLSIVVKNTYFK